MFLSSLSRLLGAGSVSHRLAELVDLQGEGELGAEVTVMSPGGLGILNATSEPGQGRPDFLSDSTWRRHAIRSSLAGQKPQSLHACRQTRVAPVGHVGLRVAKLASVRQPRTPGPAVQGVGRRGPWLNHLRRAGCRDEGMMDTGRLLVMTRGAGDPRAFPREVTAQVRPPGRAQGAPWVVKRLLPGVAGPRAIVTFLIPKQTVSRRQDTLNKELKVCTSYETSGSASAGR